MINSSISSGDFSAPQSATSWRTRSSKGGSIDDWRRDGWSWVAPAVKSSTAEFQPGLPYVHVKIRSTGILPVGPTGILPVSAVVYWNSSRRDAYWPHRQDACAT